MRQIIRIYESKSQSARVEAQRFANPDLELATLIMIKPYQNVRRQHKSLIHCGRILECKK